MLFKAWARQTDCELHWIKNAIECQLLISIGIFAIEAKLISGIFSVNESKRIVNIASKIHGIAAAVGFMAFLFFPPLNGIVALKQNKIILGIASVVSFFAGIDFFCLLYYGRQRGISKHCVEI